MKKAVLLSFLLCSTIWSALAQCLPGQSQVVVFIQPDNYPNETSWSLKDINGNLLASG
ncbi:MAG: hypothetical protein JNL88_05165, partial [Bacteroidia bacterium]|nr:hypothetical protein [Bacteroidia bacterium]